MKPINVEMPKNAVDDEKFLYIQNFSFLGFKTVPQKKMADLYFLCVCSDTKDNVVLVRNSYTLDSPNDDLAYFENPLHNIMNINKYTDIKKKAAELVFSSANSTNSYYCNFVPCATIDGNVSCQALKIMENKKAIATSLLFDMSTYLKISMIKSMVIMKNPINPILDQDARYDDIGHNIHTISDITYLGSDLANNIDSSVSSGIISLYSMVADGKRFGFMMPIMELKGKILNSVSAKNILNLYADNKSTYFMIDTTQMYIIPWLDENNIPKMTLFLIPKVDKMGAITKNLNAFMYPKDIDKCIIMNPYKDAYGEK